MSELEQKLGQYRISDHYLPTRLERIRSYLPLPKSIDAAQVVTRYDVERSHPTLPEAEQKMIFDKAYERKIKSQKAVAATLIMGILYWFTQQ